MKILIMSWCQQNILVQSQHRFGYNVILMNNKVCFSLLYMYAVYTIWPVVCQLCIWWSLLMENVKLYETGSCLPHCFLSVSLCYLSRWRDSPSTSHFSQNTSFSENVFFFASGDHAVWPHLKAILPQKNCFPHDKTHRPTF